ncbi:MAG: hypothetical protein B7733_13325 [Myxococcales bacterium FL481]|nr:MAG: hypothetical protein B7733_13325 [Myxococcales bacterium FL481]
MRRLSPSLVPWQTFAVAAEDMREIVGQTLRLTTGARHTAAQYVHLAVVRRPGLVFGWSYNVREARAEWGRPGMPEPTGLGKGRLLSWRWLDRDAADALYAARERVFADLGYEAVELPKRHRDQWDWLRELAQRQLGQASDAHHDPCAAVQHAFAALDLPTEQRLVGIASVLGLELAQLREPTAKTVCRLDGERLELALTLMRRDHDHTVRQLAMRWLEVPETLFQIRPDTLIRWCDDRPVADIVASLLPRRGLAIFGPSGVRRLAELATQPHLGRRAAALAARLRLHH